MPILFLVIFVVMAGFAMLLPSIMYVLENLGATQAEATPILASYSFAQFLIGPTWGRLSDRIGRRPTLLVSLVGSVLSYLFLSLYAASPLMILLGFVFAGFFAGNTAVVLASVSDLTHSGNRAKGMGMIGAGIGLAFTVGPIIGALVGGKDAASATITTSAAVSAALCAAGLVAVFWAFRETLEEGDGDEPAATQLNRFEAFGRLRSRPILLQICLMMLCFTMPLSMMESIFSYFMEIRYNWGPPDMGKLFLLIGLVLMIVQGGLIGRLTERFGEISLARFGVFLMGAGLFSILFVAHAMFVYIGIAITSVGTALFNTSMSALASHRAKPSERGAVLGVFQSMQSLGRSTGPLLAGVLNQQLNGLPLLTGGLVMVLVLVWVVSLHRQLDRAAATPS